MSDSGLRIERSGELLHVTLNRPEVHNAFDDTLISRMIELFEDPAQFDSVRAIVLAGSGPNFCAGADLNWMARMVEWSREDNSRDSARLAEMFRLIDSCPVPVIGRIQGAAIGGGVGLVAVCDIAIATEASRFGLSEVKLGILPAVISPYVIGKIGVSHARALFFTGERFGSERALRMGLIHGTAADEEALDQEIERVTGQLLSSGPEAVRACKKLVAYVAAAPGVAAIPYTVDAIAERRVSDEGQAGMRAFLNREKPPWMDR